MADAAVAPATRTGPDELQGGLTDVDRTRRLLRLVSLLVLWPSLSTGAALWLRTGEEHTLHTALFLTIAAGGVWLWFWAPRLARRGQTA